MAHPWKSLEDIIEFAIARECEAQAFYADLAGRIEDEALQDVLRGFVSEERSHEERLRQLQLDGLPLLTDPALAQLVADHAFPTAAPVTPEDLTLKGIYQQAIASEAAARKLYLDLAASSPLDRVREVFLALAAEEKGHQTRFENELASL